MPSPERGEFKNGRILPVLKERYTPVNNWVCKRGSMATENQPVHRYLLSTYYIPGAVLEIQDKRWTESFPKSHIPRNE